MNKVIYIYCVCISLSCGIFCLLTIPHIIYMFTDGKSGIRYSFSGMIFCSVFSTSLSLFFTKKIR